MPHKPPKNYLTLRKKHPDLLRAVQALGEAARKAGPLDDKTAHLIQLAAAASVRSEGSVHSHVRRAMESGATPAEIRHTLLLLTSTIGFPTVAAALTWAEDLLRK